MGCWAGEVVEGEGERRRRDEMWNVREWVGRRSEVAEETASREDLVVVDDIHPVK